MTDDAETAALARRLRYDGRDPKISDKAEVS